LARDAKPWHCVAGGVTASMIHPRTSGGAVARLAFRSKGLFRVSCFLSNFAFVFYFLFLIFRLSLSDIPYSGHLHSHFEILFSFRHPAFAEEYGNAKLTLL
jgi:hypothetical protein